MMTNATALRTQAHANARALLHQVRQAVGEKRFATFTIFCFLLVYLWAAHTLVGQGLDFVSKLPFVGGLFTVRLLHLLFFFFFVMLILSNATITGIGLFRRQETSWLLTLPVPPESLVLWRVVEGLLLSSWGLVLLSAPILAAFGKTFGASASFYFLSLSAILCLTVISANVSAWLLLLIVRWFRPWCWKALALGAAVSVVVLIVQYQIAPPAKLAQGDISANFREVLRHTNLCTQPLLPSTWVAEVAISTAKGQFQRALRYELILFSNALVSWLITAALARRLFFPAWNILIRRSYEQAPKAKESIWKKTFSFAWNKVSLTLRLRSSTLALAAKDARTFLREPMQWGQCVLIFGLLLAYSWNLRHLGYGDTDKFWTLVISYLNLTVCCLATSTLTTRFIFPQFSLEGQRFWILGMAPFPLTRVLRQKLWLNVCAIAPVTTILEIVSCASLNLPLHRTVFFVTAMLLLNIGLNSLALSLGALLPNFRETNPAKIVSGFGGTLCLVISFLYIIGSMCALLPPAILERTSKTIIPDNKIIIMEATCLGLLVLLTVIFGALPYHFAKTKTKELAYLGNM